MSIKDFFFKRWRQGKPGESPEVKETHAKDAVVIGVINQKGGCGKTTTVVNLSACLAELDRRVLIIDADPQGHATLGLGMRLKEQDRSLYHIIVNPEMHLSSIIKETYHPRLHLAPSNSLLASAQVDLINMIGREASLRHKINSVRSDYDYVIIDCPPSLNLLTVNVLVAACKVIIPVQTHYYSLEGMGELFKTIDVVRKRLNPSLGVLGVLPTLFDKRAKINYQILDALRNYFKNDIRIFDSIIHNCVALPESSIYGKPVIKYQPKSRSSQDYWNFAREILSMERP